MAYQTIDQLTAAGYTLHHTAAARGYISRRSEGVIREYSGRFGTGYAVHTPRMGLITTVIGAAWLASAVVRLVEWIDGDR